MTPIMKKYLDINIVPSSRPQSRPPSRPDSALSTYSRGADVHAVKTAPKHNKNAKAPVALVHHRSASVPQTAPGQYTEIATSRPAATSRPRSKKQCQEPDPGTGYTSTQDRQRPEMLPPEQIPLRPAQRPTSSLSVRSHEGAAAVSSQTARNQGKSISSAEPPPIGLVRRPAQPGSNTASTSAPLRPPMGQRAGTVEGTKDGPRRPPNKGIESDAKTEPKDAVRSTKGPKRVPLSQLETSKPNASDISLKPAPKDAHFHATDSSKGVTRDHPLKTVTSKPILTKAKSSDAAPTSQQPKLRSQKSVLSKSECGTIITRDASVPSRATKEAATKSTLSKANTRPTQDMKRKETTKDVSKSSSSQPLPKIGPGKASDAKNISSRKGKDHPGAILPPEENSVPEATPFNPEPTPAPNLIPLPPSPITADTALTPTNWIPTAAEPDADDAGPARECVKPQNEELEDDTRLAPQSVTTRPMNSRVAFLQGINELGTPFKTPISKLVSQIEREFLFTPYSDSELYDSSFELDLAPIPALAIPSKEAMCTGDESF
ncbi:hypothetical protein NEOLEDRAFT_1182994 [Neolentinus lepideus HHB14362 ss-1]|uniref:Uncharacterized protein n=1 Tax=Neolentinus lepideus HHB14362 ss-1 TaxID=1314782 RepID=A0A165NNK3_9AGAM|nr:hypothetical protein NEOLEDRAFT_1182994 [Neolentinus lepideus HHB14362 ss-1]